MERREMDCVMRFTCISWMATRGQDWIVLRQERPPGMCCHWDRACPERVAAPEWITGEKAMGCQQYEGSCHGRTHWFRAIRGRDAWSYGKVKDVHLYRNNVN